MMSVMDSKFTRVPFVACSHWFRRIGIAVFIPSLLFAASTIGLAAQAPPLKSIRVSSFISGVPVTANGVVHTTPFTLTVNPSAPLALSAPAIFDREDGFRIRSDKWLVRNQGGGPDGDYAATAIILPDTLATVSIELLISVELRITTNISGPGTVLRDPPSSPDGFIPFLSSVTLTPVPNANAYFAGWDTPWGPRDGPYSTGQVTVPVTLTAYFGARVSPSPVLSAESAFPDLRLRSSNDLTEGQVTVQSTLPLRVREVSANCAPRNLYFGFTLSSRATPFLLRAALTPENNTAPDGLYTCAIVIDRYDGAPALSLPFRVRIGQEEAENPSAVSVNGASFEKMPLAPGSIFSLFGENIGSAVEHADSLPLPQFLGGVRVRIRSGSGNYDAPLFYVSPNQINFLVPLNLTIGSGTLEIVREGANNISIPVSAEWQAPALFTADSTGSGPPAGYYMRVRGEEQERGEFVDCPDGRKCVPVSIQSSNPAEEVYLVLFGTGFRNAPSVTPQVRMGDVVAEASYFGAHRDFVGLDQINVKVPRALLGKGAQPVVVTHGAKQSNTVSIVF